MARCLPNGHVELGGFKLALAARLIPPLPLQALALARLVVSHRCLLRTCLTPAAHSRRTSYVCGAQPSLLLYYARRRICSRQGGGRHRSSRMHGRVFFGPLSSTTVYSFNRPAAHLLNTGTNLRFQCSPPQTKWPSSTAATETILLPDNLCHERPDSCRALAASPSHSQMRKFSLSSLRPQASCETTKLARARTFQQKKSLLFSRTWIVPHGCHARSPSIPNSRRDAKPSCSQGPLLLEVSMPWHREIIPECSCLFISVEFRGCHKSCGNTRQTLI
jgi:hypothetical protein